MSYKVHRIYKDIDLICQDIDIIYENIYARNTNNNNKKNGHSSFFDMFSCNIQLMSFYYHLLLLY